MSDSDDQWAGLATDGFSTFYEQTIKPALVQFERNRARDIRLVYAAWAIAGLGLVIMFFTDDDQGWLTMLGMALVMLGLITQHGVRRRMNRALKESLVAPVCQYFGLDYHQRPTAVPIRRFVQAGLLPASYDQSRAEDQISGEYRGVAINLCELTLQQTIEDKDRSSTQVVFQGMILTYRFPKPFTGETRVVPNRGGLFGWASRSGYRPRHPGDRVYLEDPVFEEHFNVYATDQVEARYLLTPRFMERLMDLSRHFSESSTQSLAFTENDLLICLRSGKDRFEGGSLLQQVSHRERVQELLGELEQVLGIVDVLDLTNQTRA